MDFYQILQLNIIKEEESGLSLLLATLSKLEHQYGHYKFNFTGQRFLFDIESQLAKSILAHTIEKPLQIDLEDFEIGDFEILDISESSEVFMHKDYLLKRKSIEKKRFKYLDFIQLSDENRKEVPFLFYEHLYSFYLENAPLEEAYTNISIAISKKMVPNALINATNTIIQDISELLIKNHSVEKLKDIIENGFKRKDFREVKSGFDSEGNPIVFYETNLKSYSHAEQKILFYGLVKDKRTYQSKRVVMHSTSNFWQLLLFITISLSKDIIFDMSKDGKFEIKIYQLLVIFNLIDGKIFQTTFEKLN